MKNKRFSLSKRDVEFTRTATYGAPDVIHRISPQTGLLMEHIGDNVYKDCATGEVYKPAASVAGQTKQDQILYPLSA